MITVRPAVREDADAISDVLIRSIVELCAADHLNDPKHIAGWTDNKSPDCIRAWFEGDVRLLVSEAKGRIGAVSGYKDDGAVELLYVAPEAQGQGHSTVLLTAMEEALTKLGCDEAKLVSSKTAQAFYLKRGWQIVGARVTCYTTDGQPMRKVLKSTNA